MSIMDHSKKSDLIRATYTLLEERGPENLSIRAIAAAAGCTTGAAYRHFKSLDHLLIVSCVKYLEDYIIELDDILENEKDPLTLHVEMWRSFSHQAFAHVDAFEVMFFDHREDELNDAIFTYYQESPDIWRKLTGFQTMVFFSSSIRERNLLTLKRCMADMGLSATTIEMLNDLELTCFHGMLMEYRDCYREPGKAEEGTNRFMNMLDYVIELIRTDA